MRRPTPLTCAALALSALMLAPLLPGCGGGGGGTDMGPVFEDRDAGNDTCTNSLVTCGDLSQITYQICTTEDDSACYLRRSGTRYDCAAACGVVGGCFEATEQLVAEQCP